jgi:GR25 family glycosyltransferase involved in LPS biosynthesis
MEDILKFINIKSERINAINGRLIKNFIYKHLLSPGELGWCTLSHLKNLHWKIVQVSIL